MSRSDPPIRAGLLALFLALLGMPLAAAHANFITIDGHRLMDGDTQFRFIGWNIPGLIKHYDGYKMIRPESGYLYDPPDAFEQRDYFTTMQQLGATVVRIWGLGVTTSAYPDRGLRYPVLVTGPGEYDATIFANLDRAIQLAHAYDVRLIVTFINNHHYWGSENDFAALYGSDDFYGDATVRTGFKQLLHDVVTRVNTLTGVMYRDDPAILAWELGNELDPVPVDWDRAMVEYLHGIDPNHFVMSFSDATDVYHPHHYPAAAGKLPTEAPDKPYLVGEFGAIAPLDEVIAELDAIVARPYLSGGLIWSIESHHSGGGWRAHAMNCGSYHAIQWGNTHDPWGAGVAAHARTSAYAIRGLDEPPLPAPDAPELLPCRDPMPALRWRGSVGAHHYTIERASSRHGPWTVVASEVHDHHSYFFHALWSDTSAPTGERLHYRVRAINDQGTSPPSNVIGVEVARLKLADDLEDFSKVARHDGLTITVPVHTRESYEDPRGAYGTGALIYHRNDIRAFRITGFRADTASFATSANGVDYHPFTAYDLETCRDDNSYGSLWDRHIWQSHAPLPDGTDYLKISVDGVHLARIDLDYGGAPDGTALVVDNRDPGCSASAGWRLSSKRDQRWGPDYLAIDADDGADSVTWAAPVPNPGWYSVWTYQIGDLTAFAPDARYRIDHTDGSHIHGADLRTGSGWHLLGIHPFRGAPAEGVTLTSASAGDYLYADAVMYRFLAPLRDRRHILIDATLDAPDTCTVFQLDPPADHDGLPADFHTFRDRDSVIAFLLAAAQ